MFPIQKKSSGRFCNLTRLLTLEPLLHIAALTLVAFLAVLQLQQDIGVATATTIEEGQTGRSSNNTKQPISPFRSAVKYTVVLQKSYRGYTCASECRSGGDGYNWCYVDKGSFMGRIFWDNWDPCSVKDVQVKVLESMAVDGVLSSHGIPCSTKCRRTGSDEYFSCSTLFKWKSHTWDYCSPTPGLDYWGKNCSAPCDYNGKPYKWCQLAEGGWGYCSKDREFNEGQRATVTASHGIRCSSQCGEFGGKSYSWCTLTREYNGNYWDYCSAIPGYDYRGMKCADACGSHGYKYAWCKRVGGGWGYCSA